MSRLRWWCGGSQQVKRENGLPGCRLDEPASHLTYGHLHPAIGLEPQTRQLVFPEYWAAYSNRWAPLAIALRDQTYWTDFTGRSAVRAAI